MKRISKTDKLKIAKRARKKGERDRLRAIYAREVILMWRNQNG